MVQPLPADALTANPQAWLAVRPESPEPSALVGQQRALTALQHAQRLTSAWSHVYAVMPAGLFTTDIIEQTAKLQKWTASRLSDWVYLANPEDPHAPKAVDLPAGQAESAVADLWEFLNIEPEARDDRYLSMVTQYPSQRFIAYLNEVRHLTFDDLPGQELANIIVSHQDPKPWYYCNQVTSSNLFGDIRLQSIEGTVSTELHLIRPGAVHKANGRTLVIDAQELLSKPQLWFQLKHMLRNQEFTWPQPGQQKTAIYYAPEPIPMDLKVILAGSRPLFGQLRDLDRDFSRIFPILADFTLYYPAHQPEMAPYFKFLAYLAWKTDHRPLHQEAWGELLIAAAELTGQQTELSLDAVALAQLLEEANMLAEQDGSGRITVAHLRSARWHQEWRSRQLAEDSWDMILTDQIYIPTTGTERGQVNGLTVVSAAGSEFGEPSRITASIHHGEGEIIDIERKAELSGEIHTKGVLILAGYLAQQFAPHEPMPIGATLVFEQSYHEVDGDSASLAELISLISALAETPVRQDLAVTGAIDQFGRVQAVGGLSEKIKAWFYLCNARGLTGSQGVILPASNRVNLLLEEDILTAVAAGKFNIYPVDHVQEALELMSGLPLGEPLKPDSQTLYGRVRQQLESHQQTEQPARSRWQQFKRWLSR